MRTLHKARPGVLQSEAQKPGGIVSIREYDLPCFTDCLADGAKIHTANADYTYPQECTQ